MSFSRISTGTIAAVITALICLPAVSRDGEAQEPADAAPAPETVSSCPDPVLGPVMPPAPDRTDAPIVIFARELDAGRTTVGEARGEVELFRADQHLSTDRVLYDPVSKVITIPGELEYKDQQVWFRGQEASYSFLEESGRFYGIDYGLTGSSANGRAEAAELVGGRTSILRGLDYTTCPGTRPDWQLQARELELQHEEGMGKARGAKLTFKNVPVLYAPYFTFPIDDRRKTGFLYPNLGQNSDSGFEIGIPWYWNIAPNQDAILEPHYFTNRGFMLFGQYRFLTRRTSGRLELDYMPRDRQTRQERYRYLLNHTTTPRERWRTDLVIERVSDNRFFQDFGTNLGQTSLQFLRSNAQLTGVGRYWNLELMADDFQVIDDSVEAFNEPYRRIPRLGYWLDRPLGSRGLNLALDSELVYFHRDVGTTGGRLDVHPRLYWDMRRSWGFLRPTAGYRYTAYALDLEGEAGEDAPSTGVPILSLDGGLVFDRRLSNGDLQTLEPRLFYLYVPFERQDDQPVFDSGEFTFGFSQLFNTNRFAGGDRQTDANQLSLALSTRRFEGASGRVLWSLSLGQIFYFEPQRVQLGMAPAFDEDYSPFLAEFNWRPFARVSGTLGVQWDWERSRLDVGMIGVHYRGNQGRRASFEYRFRRDRVDQFDLRAYWPIDEQWRVLSRIKYSLADNDMLEIQGGVEYESCCWAFRTVLRRYLKNRDGDYRNAIYLELNLKGLASIGTRGEELFRD